MSKYKNQVTLAIFLLGTIMVVVYALRWHAVYEENRRNKAVISDFINEIKADEFDNYINDNRDAVIYFGITNGDECNQFETDFKDYIVEYNLQETIVYLNVNWLKGDNFGQELDTKYNSDELRNKNRFLSEVPALGVFKNAILTDFLQGDNLTANKAVDMLKKHDVIEEVIYNGNY